MSQLHARTLSDELGVESLLDAIAVATEAPVVKVDDPAAFVEQIARIEATLPVKAILLEPFISPHWTRQSSLLTVPIKNLGVHQSKSHSLVGLNRGPAHQKMRTPDALAMLELSSLENSR
jgi:hypothetical protein